MNLFYSFQQYISEHQLLTKQQKLLIAVSGGVDSIVLCHLCDQAGFRLAIAHCNFGLRGEESERDATFVKELANQYGVPLYLKQFETKRIAEEQRLSIQVVARELRYNWFNDIINHRELPQQNEFSNQNIDIPFSFIITAHHLDDNIETVLMNFFKGTGISGIKGIKPKNGKIVRPLLFASKEDIVQYALANNLAWVEDSSNEENKYTRNLLRNEVIPLLQKVLPTVKTNIASNINRFQEVEVLYKQAIDIHKKKLIEEKVGDVHISVLKLKKAKPQNSIIYEIIKDYGFEHAQLPECIKLLNSNSGKYILSATHRILRNRAWLIISPLQVKEQQLYVIDDMNDIVKMLDKQLTIEYLEVVPAEIPSQPDIALIDKSGLKFPLILRKWKEGDYFYPLGMRKKKKLSRFFIDKKLSLLEKENTWVLESDKRIVWVVGQRIDDRFKITHSTKEVIRINWSSL